MWLRIFAPTETTPDPVALLAHLEAAGFTLSGDFRGDDTGWTSLELRFRDAGEQTPVFVERYLTEADDLRPDLNSWAAWLETATWSDHHRTLMEQVIVTRQLITVRRPYDHADEVQLERLCTTLATWLAGQLGGFYQADALGFVAADGTLLVAEY